jgi:hypothetical protein
LSFFGEHFGVHSSGEDHQKLSTFGHEFLTICWFQLNAIFTYELIDNPCFQSRLISLENSWLMRNASAAAVGIVVDVHTGINLLAVKAMGYWRRSTRE